METFKYTTIDFLLSYLEYLNRWNKSASLESIIGSVRNNNHVSDYWKKNRSELINIALFEYQDTCDMVRNLYVPPLVILSMEDVVRQCYADKREEKLKELLG